MSYDTNSPNYVEFSVGVEPTSKTRLYKFLIVFVATVVFTAALYISGSLLGPLTIGTVVPVGMLLIGLSMAALWKYTSVEYDCILASGEMQMSIIYGSKKRKELFTQKISSFEIIADAITTPINDSNFNKVYKCITSENADNIVYATFKNSKGERTIVYFQPTQKAHTILKFYNRTAYKIG